MLVGCRVRSLMWKMHGLGVSVSVSESVHEMKMEGV